MQPACLLSRHGLGHLEELVKKETRVGCRDFGVQLSQTTKLCYQSLHSEALQTCSIEVQPTQKNAQLLSVELNEYV